MASFGCYDNSDVIATRDHNKFSSLSNTTVVAVFPNLCLWRRSLYSNLGGIDPEKLYRATLKGIIIYYANPTSLTKEQQKVMLSQCSPLHWFSTLFLFN